MKRLLTLLISLVMILCLGACGRNSNDVPQTEDPDDTGVIEEDGTEESDSIGDYTLVYFQSGPLALVYDNKDENHGVGAFDSSGKLVIPCKYASLEYIGKDRYLISESDGEDNLKYGISDLEGNEIVPCEYESIEPVIENAVYYFLDGYKEPEGEYVTAWKEGSDAGEYISIIDGRSAQKPEESMMLTYDNDAKGTFHGDYIIPVPDEISRNYEDSWGMPYGSNECTYYEGVQCHYYVIVDDNGDQGITDTGGRELGNGARWKQVGFEYGNGLIAVSKSDDGPWALIDSEGNEVTDYIFNVTFDNA